MAIQAVFRTYLSCLMCIEFNDVMSFLAIDVGNTRLKWALYKEITPGSELIANGAVFLEHVDDLAENDWKNLPKPQSMLGCVVAGDSLRFRVQEQMGQLWPDLSPRWIVPRAQEASITNSYDIPSRLGADRWAAIIGARHRMLQTTAGQPPRPIIVVMVGTAVTIEAIDQTGTFLGGYILPGYGLMLRALETGAAGLHHMPTGSVVSFPTNTSDALTSGGTFALVGAVEYMVRQLHNQCGQPPMCFMTGGAGWKIMPYMETQFKLVESLIFDGLLVIAEKAEH